MLVDWTKIKNIFKAADERIFQIYTKFYSVSVKDRHGLTNDVSRLFYNFLYRSQTVYLQLLWSAKFL
jgi:hypothetical protein